MSDFSFAMEALYAEQEKKRAEKLIVHPVQYPDAHLLGLAIEILDLIFDELAALSPGSLWFKGTQLHISATSPPPLPLLLAHSKLHAEASASSTNILQLYFISMLLMQLNVLPSTNSMGSSCENVHIFHA